MNQPSMFILYVKDAHASAAFYSELLGVSADQQGPGFAMLNLESGVMLAFWSAEMTQPASDVTGGGTEVAISADSPAQVDKICADWRKRGMTIAQEPVQMPFGYTFVALDADAHRLRVSSLRGGQ